MTQTPKQETGTMPTTKPPMTADEVRRFIAQLDRECRSKAARIRMAELAIEIGNISPGGIQLWRDYLATQV